MKFFAIDVETTGLDRDNCQILEFAAVYCDLTDDSVPTTELPLFHCYVNPGTIVGEPYALNMNRDTLAILAGVAKTTSLIYDTNEVSRAFADWVSKQGLASGYPLKINVAGKNYASFDAYFVNRLPFWSTYFKVHHRVVDPAPIYLLKDDAVMPDLQTCLTRGGITRIVKHTAAADAYDVIDLLRLKR